MKNKSELFLIIIPLQGYYNISQVLFIGGRISRYFKFYTVYVRIYPVIVIVVNSKAFIGARQ